MTKQIRAILFDLDGTLRHHLPAGDEVFMEYVKNCGVNFSDEDAIRARHWEHYYFAFSPEIQADGNTFKDDTKGFWINYAKRFMVALGVPEAQSAGLAPAASAHMDKNYRPEVYVPEEIPFVLTKLKEAGYVLGIVTNRDQPVHEELKLLNLDSYFNFSLAGGEVGSFKPEPRIFEHALERSGTAAAETMYIGDNYFADIVGSLRAGLAPVLYDPSRLFPNADCTVIQSFVQLPDLLE